MTPVRWPSIRPPRNGSCPCSWGRARRRSVRARRWSRWNSSRPASAFAARDATIGAHPGPLPPGIIGFQCTGGNHVMVVRGRMSRTRRDGETDIEGQRRGGWPDGSRVVVPKTRGVRRRWSVDIVLSGSGRRRANRAADNREVVSDTTPPIQRSLELHPSPNRKTFEDLEPGGEVGEDPERIIPCDDYFPRGGNRLGGGSIPLRQRRFARRYEKPAPEPRCHWERGGLPTGLEQSDLSTGRLQDYRPLPCPGVAEDPSRHRYWGPPGQPIIAVAAGYVTETYTGKCAGPIVVIDHGRDKDGKP